MADFLHRLAEKILNPSPSVQPLSNQYSALETVFPKPLSTLNDKDAGHDHVAENPTQVRPVTPPGRVREIDGAMDAPSTPEVKQDGPGPQIKRPHDGATQPVHSFSESVPLAGGSGVSRVAPELIPDEKGPGEKNESDGYQERRAAAASTYILNNEQKIFVESCINEQPVPVRAETGDEPASLAERMPGPLVEPEPEHVHRKAGAPSISSKGIEKKDAGPAFSNSNRIEDRPDSAPLRSRQISERDVFESNSSKDDVPQTIRVTIGRVDVRAVFQSEPEKQRSSTRRQPQGLSLEEYLRSHNGARR